MFYENNSEDYLYVLIQVYNYAVDRKYYIFLLKNLKDKNQTKSRYKIVPKSELQPQPQLQPQPNHKFTTTTTTTSNKTSRDSNFVKKKYLNIR